MLVSWRCLWALGREGVMMLGVNTQGPMISREEKPATTTSCLLSLGGSSPFCMPHSTAPRIIVTVLHYDRAGGYGTTTTTHVQ